MADNISRNQVHFSSNKWQYRLNSSQKSSQKFFSIRQSARISTRKSFWMRKFIEDFQWEIMNSKILLASIKIKLLIAREVNNFWIIAVLFFFCSKKSIANIYVIFLLLKGNQSHSKNKLWVGENNQSTTQLFFNLQKSLYFNANGFYFSQKKGFFFVFYTLLMTS